MKRMLFNNVKYLINLFIKLCKLIFYLTIIIFNEIKHCSEIG